MSPPAVVPLRSICGKFLAPGASSRARPQWTTRSRQSLALHQPKECARSGHSDGEEPLGERPESHKEPRLNHAVVFSWVACAHAAILVARDASSRYGVASP